MSQKNGDKSRYQINRKRTVLRREDSRDGGGGATRCDAPEHTRSATSREGLTFPTHAAEAAARDPPRRPSLTSSAGAEGRAQPSPTERTDAWTMSVSP
jgi:hypothetical protein